MKTALIITAMLLVVGPAVAFNSTGLPPVQNPMEQLEAGSFNDEFVPDAQEFPDHYYSTQETGRAPDYRYAEQLENEDRYYLGADVDCYYPEPHEHPDRSWPILIRIEPQSRQSEPERGGFPRVPPLAAERPSVESDGREGPVPPAEVMLPPVVAW